MPVASSNFMVTSPALRRRADLAPALRSADRVPMSASFRFHVPLDNVTSAAAYEPLLALSNPSVATTTALSRRPTPSSTGSAHEAENDASRDDRTTAVRRRMAHLGPQPA